MKCILRIVLAMSFIASLVACDKPSGNLSATAVSVSGAGKKASPSIVFDGNRAFEYLKAMVEFGPRPSGSKANGATQKFILQTLTRQGIAVEEEPFLATTPRGKIPMNNLIAKIPGASSEVIVLGGHYDTKLFETIRFVGANDGGSSAAFLLEIAGILKRRKNSLTIWCVFFDGEEAVREWTDTDSVYGSRHFVQHMKSSNRLSKIKAMLLVDMIGDRDLNLLKESNSTSWLVDILWDSGAGMGFRKNFLPESFSIGGDDHFPFLQEGIPAVDLIDFDFGFANAYWHSEQDTVDKCSPRSLQIVGDTVLKALPFIESRFLQK
ncbi:MAG: M28 family peptidase [Acidobacteriia bacterium]|nr:M28 family peptidase [Terriglobia bacterium]